MTEPIIVRNSENHKGIFYHSDVEYKIIGETDEGNISQLSHYEEAKTYWSSTNEKPQVLIKFSHQILITNYSIFKNYGNSYPYTFILYGKQNGKFVELDKRENQSFDGDEALTKNNCTVTYQTKTPFLTSQVLLKQIRSSSGVRYMLLRALEFYGVVCKNCRTFGKVTCAIKNRYNHESCLFVTVILTIFS